MKFRAAPTLVLVGLSALSASAFAAAATKTGDVKSTDVTSHQLTLDTGDTFSVASGVKLQKFKVGDKVAVTYETKDGKMVASKVHHVK